MIWPKPERPAETSFAEMFIDGALMLAREGARITKLYLPTRDFLWLAWQASVRDEHARVRPVLRPVLPYGVTSDWASASPQAETFQTIVVQVGDRFTMHAPWGAVEIIEDKEA